MEWIETPDVFRKSKPSIGARLPTYAVFPTAQPVGGVMTTHIDFEDAPDVESIAGGVHSRHPDSPVIARHGAYVLWGFEGTPDRMTETGRRLLLNVMAYAHAHRGEKPVVKVLTRAREYSHRPEAERPFLYSPDGRKLAVDEIAKRHGVANDTIEFLRMIGRRLGSDPHDADALTLVERYCPEARQTDFAAWLATHEDDLFFTDWGGYRWFSRREVLRQSLARPEGSSR